VTNEIIFKRILVAATDDAIRERGGCGATEMLGYRIGLVWPKPEKVGRAEKNAKST